MNGEVGVAQYTQDLCSYFLRFCRLSDGLPLLTVMTHVTMLKSNRPGSLFQPPLPHGPSWLSPPPATHRRSFFGSQRLKSKPPLHASGRSLLNCHHHELQPQGQDRRSHSPTFRYRATGRWRICQARANTANLCCYASVRRYVTLSCCSLLVRSDPTKIMEYPCVVCN